MIVSMSVVGIRGTDDIHCRCEWLVGMTYWSVGIFTSINLIDFMGKNINLTKIVATTTFIVV